MGKFFVPPECIKGQIVLIKGNQAHHILDVLRMQRADQLQVFDGSGKVYQGHIVETKDKQVKLKITSVLREAKLSQVTIALLQALPKQKKIDYVIEKSTELGVGLIIPAQTARTIVRLDQKRADARHLRWQRIASQAAQQSGRTTIPEIKKLQNWTEALALVRDFDLKLLACLSPKAQPIKNVLRSRKRVHKVALAIGPEGDFTTQETEQAKAAGCVTVSLGADVLKTDTAAVATLAMLNYELRQ